MPDAREKYGTKVRLSWAFANFQAKIEVSGDDNPTRASAL